jgi:hypothetical protein
MQWILANGLGLIAAANAVMVALIGLFAMIPGDQPEKALQAVVDFISKFSKK